MRKIDYERSLLHKSPNLATEWDYDKNAELQPDNVTAFSNKKVWWKCYRGHRWDATIASRSQGTRCPFCTGALPILGNTDLKTKQPDLAKEWDYKRNKMLTPEQMAEFSSKKVWWKCRKGHCWEATIASRAMGRGCPVCGRRRVLVGVNDLKTMRPDLAEEWDYERNNGLIPEDVAEYSTKKAWWKCKEGHNWEAMISTRSTGRGCPFCSRKKLLVGVTDLKTMCPDLVEEWDYDKNDGLMPEDVAASTKLRVWWRCAHNHGWMAAINNRANGTGCPYCDGRLPIVGETDLRTKHPQIAKEWDENNNNINPEDVTECSGKKINWKCSKGHCWKAAISMRTSKGSGCPYCAGKLPILGETDLKTTHPDLVDIWDYEKNYGLKPEDVTRGSTKKVWWKCSENHQWWSTIRSRVMSSNCPYCNGTRKYKSPVEEEEEQNGKL